MESTYVIGVDFGTNSVRCVVSDTKDGAILASEEAEYRRWARGLYCTPKENVYRQHPKDYLEALETCIKTAVASLPQELAAQIAAIGIDTTGSTPGPVNREGIPLAMTPEFAENPDAMFWLWKDHSALREAKLVDDVFSAPPVSYTKYQGQYSSEWYWAKILHAVCSAPEVGAEAVAWVEHCDWIAAELTGERLPERIFRSSCSAGHKALFHSEWGGLPDAARLSRLSPVLVKYAANYRLPPVPAGTAVGKISEAWACRLGLSKTVVIAAGSLDAHAGAVGVGIGENVLACAFGTSSVDMLIAKPEDVADKNLTFTCGQAENSIIPGYVGIESGQAAFGDLFAWLRGLLLWPVEQFPELFSPETEKTLMSGILERLNCAAAERGFPAGALATDWLNGRRYPYPDETATGTITGLRLSSDAVELYQALVLASAFGLRSIIENLGENGLTIEKILATGGVSQKSPYVIQTVCDVTGLPVEVPLASQITALGAAIYAAVACGKYPDISSAQVRMCPKKSKYYLPDIARHEQYEELFEQYRSMRKKKASR